MRISIGQSLAADALQRTIRASLVIDAKPNAVAVPKIKLREIAVQMLFGAVLINTIDATLEDAEITLDGVGVHMPANVLFCLVGDGFVRRKVMTDVSLSGSFIAHEVAFSRDIPAHDATQVIGADCGDVE